MMRCFPCWHIIPLAVAMVVASRPVPAQDSTPASTDRPTAEQIAFFESRIRPLLIDRCLDCHGEDDPESGLSLATREAMLVGGKLGPAIVPGKPKQSLLIAAINHDEFIKMPPKEKLSTVELVDLTRWVEMGAPWPKTKSPAATVDEPRREPAEQGGYAESQLNFWAFQPPVRAELPVVLDMRWPQAPVDYFISAGLDNAGLAPSPRADKRTLIRRATYDLTGLPPTPLEIDAFLRDDSPLAFTKVIDRLLASPRYGERWGRHWLDVARFADSNGLDENLSYANAFRYRDYVIAALNADLAYDRFVTEQIAGDLLDEPDNLDRFVATGFLAIGPKMLAEDDPVKMQMDIIDEQLNTLGQAFMGLTIGCARCHDHKFDPISTVDYYALAGIFKSTKTMENHNVVAVWYERPLINQEIRAAQAGIDKQIEAAKTELGDIEKATRQRFAADVRRRISPYLLATLDLDRFVNRDKQAARKPRANAAMEPFEVRDGYAVIEAESFQRGNVERILDGYGQGIGVVASRGAGYLEYDLMVERAGEYQLEVRYAAEASRPFQLLLNGDEVSQSIGSKVTGSWYPDGQTWFIEGKLDLPRGKNTVRFDSNAVYPHIDRFALIYRPKEAWPFDTEQPLSLSGIAARHGVTISVVRKWRAFLAKVATNELPEQSAFLPWTILSQLPQDQIAERARSLFCDSQDEASLVRRVPEVVRVAFEEARPQSIDEVARIYQDLVTRADHVGSSSSSAAENELLEPLAKQLSARESPLTEPAENLDELYSPEQSRRVRQVSADIKRLEKARPQPPVAMGVTESTPQDIRVHLRGSHIALGQTVPRGFPRFLSGSGQTAMSPSQSGRLELARWLTRPNHPLTSRVIANRLWHWHFGRGIVSSVDNLGSLGDRPTHPELLDWLAIELVESNWSLKALHRHIMLSSTYQMSTQRRAEAERVDPENKLLWRMNRRRLTAEEIRDSIIACGAGLAGQIGGSLLQVANRAYVTGSGTNVTTEYDNLRRSVYLPVIRSSVYDVLQALDFPDPAYIAGRRQTSTIAPQALMMMNSKLVQEHAAACAEAVMAVGKSDRRRIELAYRRVLKRPATRHETVDAEGYIRKARSVIRGAEKELSETQEAERELAVWQSLCRVLMSTNEFVYIE